MYAHAYVYPDGEQERDVYVCMDVRLVSHGMCAAPLSPVYASATIRKSKLALCFALAGVKNNRRKYGRACMFLIVPC